LSSRVFETSSRRLREFVDRYDEPVVDDINGVCPSHVLTLDVDETGKFTYNGVDVHDGKLRFVFNPENISTNIGDGISKSLADAINEAPGSGHALPFKVRAGIRLEYEPKAEEVRAKIAELLNKPDVKIVPNFEANYEKLREHSTKKGSNLDRDWQSNLGPWTLLYFEGVVSQLSWQKFGEDDMLQEGFNEAVDKSEITLQIVDKLEKRSYGEFNIEDGVFVLKTNPENWGRNIDSLAEKMVDAL
jgi:hypothetical protein